MPVMMCFIVRLDLGRGVQVQSRAWKTRLGMFRREVEIGHGIPLLSDGANAWRVHTRGG